MLLKRLSLLIAGAVSCVEAHGIMTSPTPRAVGNSTAAACGSQVAAIIQGDPTSHVEGLPEAAATDSTFDASKCNLFLCKGLQFADNQNNVVALTAGQSLELKFRIPIPHEGPCNVSVVDTKTNTLIGPPLINFASYADESLPVLPKNNTDMTVTVPTTLGSKCAVAGDCVIQWFWFGTAADQTYESCLDFTLADASNTGAESSASASESTVATSQQTQATSSKATNGSSNSATSTGAASTTTRSSSATTASSPVLSTNAASLSASQLFNFGDLKVVAAWLFAANLALVMMS